jgi:hypothetical protein
MLGLAEPVQPGGEIMREAIISTVIDSETGRNSATVQEGDPLTDEAIRAAFDLWMAQPKRVEFFAGVVGETLLDGMIDQIERDKRPPMGQPE